MSDDDVSSSSDSSSSGDSLAEMVAAAGAGAYGGVPPAASGGNTGGGGTSDDDLSDEAEAEAEAAVRPELSPVPTSVASTMTPDQLDQSLAAEEAHDDPTGAGRLMVPPGGGKVLRLAAADDDDESEEEDDDDDEVEEDEDDDDDDNDDDESGASSGGALTPPPPPVITTAAGTSPAAAEDEEDAAEAAAPPPPSAAAAGPMSRGKVMRRDILDAFTNDSDEDDEDDKEEEEVAAVETMDVDGVNGNFAASAPVPMDTAVDADGASDSDSSEDIPIAQVRKQKQRQQQPKKKKKRASTTSTASPKAKTRTKKTTPTTKARSFSDDLGVVDATIVADDDDIVEAAVVDDDDDHDHDGGDNDGHGHDESMMAAAEVVVEAAIVDDGGAADATTPTPKKKRKKPSTTTPKSKKGREVKKDYGLTKAGVPRKKPGPKKGWNKVAGAGTGTPSGGKKKKKKKARTPGSSSSKKVSSRKRKHPERFTEDGGRWEDWPAEAFVTAAEDDASPYDRRLAQYAATVPAQKMDAAVSARSFLASSVDMLPFPVSENQVVRSFGRIKIEKRVILPPEGEDGVGATTAGNKDGTGTLYSSAAAIHPVGFSCDRFEFSPIHGRIIRLRCDILDGAKVRKLRKAQRDAAASAAEARAKRKAKKEKEAMAEADVVKADAEVPVVPSSTELVQVADGEDAAAAVVVPDESSTPMNAEAKDVAEDNEGGLVSLIPQEEDDNYDGPVFRVMWGAGVEQNPENDYSYPYAVYSASAPLTDDVVDAIAVPADGPKMVRGLAPEVGMRVTVRFDENIWYGGTIVQVKDKKKSSKKPVTPVQRIIAIHYDDGMREEAAFPDPDIMLRPPGTEIEGLERGQVDVTEIRGKPVISASGKTAIEAWGKTLITLGLIDELMYQPALRSLELSREEAKNEAQEKLDLQQKQRQEARIREREKLKKKKEAAAKADAEASDNVAVESTGVDGPDAATPTKTGDEKKEDGSSPDREESAAAVTDQNNADDAAAAVAEEEGDLEPASEREEELRARIEALRERLDVAQNESQVSSTDLAEARIKGLGPFFNNPFADLESTLSQQHSWLSSIVRKEKAKMGSTGSKRKVVSAADLLERSDTIFNPDIERLIEGLPGSEFCPSYIFHSHRSGGAAAASSSWVQEAQLRHEKEQQKKVKASQKAKEKAKVESTKMKEKELKRKKREDEHAARKKKKLEQEEKIKQAREDERMSRLSLQVDNRLLKEANAQRKKVIEAMAKAVGKEFLRRRRAAEIVASDFVESSQGSQTLGGDPMIDTFQRSLPPLARRYDVDVIKVWDFISSFEGMLKDFDPDATLPSLDSLQEALDVIRNAPQTLSGDIGTENKRQEAVDVLANLAVSLCKPLASGLVKLFSSVVATETEVESVDEKSSTSDEEDPDVLPVTDTTWREVARLSLLGDALVELGCNKQETVAILRGWRNAGHPNSKEAKRLRRGEDHGIATLRQELQELSQSAEDGGSKNGGRGSITVKVTAPCKPSALPTDWTFYLHNIKSLEPNDVTAIKGNLRKAIAIIKQEKSNKEKSDKILKDLIGNLSVFDNVSKSSNDSAEVIDACTKARAKALSVLDEETGEPFSADSKGEIVYRETSQAVGGAGASSTSKPPVRMADRQSMGLVDDLMVTEDEYKENMHRREAYIEESEILKEEVDKRLKREAGEEVDEDEEDDDDDDDDDMSVEGEKGEGNDSKKSSPKSSPSKEGDDNDGGKQKGAKQTSNVVADKSFEQDSDAEKRNHSADTTEDAIDDGKIGKPTPYDFFCADDSSYPELIRRCLAVLRTLCMSPAGETFIYPVDAQANPRYYELILKPVSLYDMGKLLRDTGKRLAAKGTRSLASTQGDASAASAAAQPNKVDEEVETVVAEFGRGVRRIALNTACYSNVGTSIIASSDEMMKLFERLFFDWVLAPPELLPPLELLDDDKCIDPHESDAGALILICDGCEAKYNMGRLQPPMETVPKGDWYCQRCVSGRSWAQVDPRIGRKIRRRLPDSSTGAEIEQETAARSYKGTISRCVFRRPDKSSKSSLAYVISYADGDEEVLSLDEVDKELTSAGNPAPPIRCFEAVAESPGYGVKTGADQGLIHEFVPPFIDPNLSDPAAQACHSNSIFRDTIRSCATLSLLSAQAMTSSEWLRLLVLLVTKCSSNESLQEVASELESKANGLMSERITETSKINAFYDLLPKVTDDEYDDEDSAAIERSKAEDECKPSAEEKKKTKDDPIVEAIVESKKPSDAINTKGNSGDAEDVAGIVEAIPVVEADPADNISDVIKSSVSGRDTPSSLVPDVIMSEEELRKRKIIKAKIKRQRAVEDCYIASAVKNLMKPTVASFEEDNFSQVVGPFLAPNSRVVPLASLLCRGVVCDFCKLPETALGLPLLRVPNQKEWLENMQYCASNRKCRLIAAMPASSNGLLKDDTSSVEDDGDQVMSNAEDTRDENKEGQEATAVPEAKVSKLVSVTIRVNGELASDRLDIEEDDQQPERGMLEFLPRNPVGMQDELRSRAENDVLFVTGSLSAHECCAVAAHKARKDAVVQHHRDLASTFAEKDAASTCGRTVPLGYDKVGRAYFRFQSDPSSLFVVDNEEVASKKQWHRFSRPEDIACIITCLADQDPGEELRARYPDAAELIRNRKWADRIQKRSFSVDITKLSEDEEDGEEEGKDVSVQDTAVPMDVDGEAKKDETQQQQPQASNAVKLLDPLEAPYVEGEEVLVESATGKLLWDAVIVAVSKDRGTDRVSGYRVHYKGWSSRFDEWVDILRVVEPSPHNILCQSELLDEFFGGRRADNVPTSLEGMAAASYLHHKNRARGSAPLPNFGDVISVGPGASAEDEAVGKTKAALLLIEAALPKGAIDTSKSSVWTSDAAAAWRTMIRDAEGPGSLMGCLLLLETSILEDFFYPQAFYLLQCLHTHWKAMKDASYSSIALRIAVLDRAIKYDAVSSRKKRR